MAWPKEDGRPPHDALFKAVFGDARHAAAFLKAELPPALVERIDFSTLKRAPGSFVDKKLSQFHTDVLFKVRLAGEEGLLYVLCEHQSADHPLMAFRVLEYTVSVWRAWLKENPKARRLPPLIPIVLYHGPRGWKAKTTVHDLVMWPRGLRLALAPYVPEQRYLLEDLTRIARTDFKSLPLSELGRLALYMLQHSRGGDDAIFAGLKEMRELLETSVRQDGALALVLIRYILSVTDDRERFIEEIAPGLQTPAKEAVLSIAEQLRTEGRAEGRAVGELEGMARMLFRQLSLKFGAVPAPFQERIAAATTDEIDHWAERILRAESIEAVFEA